MSVINVLDPQTANLIAAGEVVDRPASVVKELLENAIDSGATRIVAEIKNGGNTYIRVTDNGCGMSAEDAATCVKRHATSKIHSPEDLFSISTLGFRGEALAAISSVSRFSIITKMADASIGTKFEIEGDEVLFYDDYGCPDGTTVTVCELFKNQPARQKFLKRDATEAAAVLQYVQRIAVSRPEISFTFISNNETKLQTPGDNDLKKAIYCVYGKEFTSALTPVQAQSEQGIEVSGFVTRPDASRVNRSSQSFYINHRYVKSKTMLFALEDAYKSYMKTDRFPGCVLNLQIDFSRVDVNVHPAKLEVRFSDERTVYNAVYFAVKNALKAEKSPLIYESASPLEAVERFVKKEEVKNTQVEFEIAMPKIPPYRPFSSTVTVSSPTEDEIKARKEKGELSSDEKRYLDEASKMIFEKPTAGSERKEPHSSCPDFSSPLSQKQETSPENSSRTEEFVIQAPFGSDGKILGIAFNAFILYEHEENLFFIDKHAAHERILYEKIKKDYKDNSIQALIEPITVSLSGQQLATAEEFLSEFEKIGFLAESFGPSDFALRGVPFSLSHLSTKVLGEIFIRTLDDLMQGGRVSAKKEGALDKIMYSMACKAAMKAGIKDHPQEYRAIIETLVQIGNIVVCPHGRPIVTKITQKQLERLFLRNG